MKMDFSRIFRKYIYIKIETIDESIYLLANNQEKSNRFNLLSQSFFRCVCVTERVKNNRESSEEINRRLEGGILRFDQGESKDIDEYLKRSRLLLSTA